MVILSLSSHVSNLLLTAPSAPTTTGTTTTRLIPHEFSNLPLQILVFFNLFTLLFIDSVIPWWSNIHNNCLVTLFLNNNNDRSSGLNNMVTLDGHVLQYLICTLFHFPLSHPVVFIPLLTSVQAILTANGPASLVKLSCLLLYCFCAKHLHSPIIWFIVSLFSAQNLQSGETDLSMLNWT